MIKKQLSQKSNAIDHNFVKIIKNKIYFLMDTGGYIRDGLSLVDFKND